jgi:hypothetical protein
MNITVNFDITPQEMRKLLGLPDVEEFQKQMLDNLRERMMAGVEGYDPVKLFQPYVSGTLASWDMFQKFLSAATPHVKSKSTDDSAPAEDKT